MMVSQAFRMSTALIAFLVTFLMETADLSRDPMVATNLFIEISYWELWR